MAKFTRELTYRIAPVRRAYPRRGIIQPEVYQTLMYATPRRFSLYIRNRIRPERRQEKSRTALGRGISEGVRLNDNQIVVSRGPQRIPQMGYF